MDKGGKKGPVCVHLDGLGHVVVDDQWHVLDVDTYEEKIDLFFTKSMWWTDKTTVLNNLYNKKNGEEIIHTIRYKIDNIL